MEPVLTKAGHNMTTYVVDEIIMGIEKNEYLLHISIRIVMTLTARLFVC